jgi:hypothetical protein
MIYPENTRLRSLRPTCNEPGTNHKQKNWPGKEKSVWTLVGYKKGGQRSAVSLKDGVPFLVSCCRFPGVVWHWTRRREAQGFPILGSKAGAPGNGRTIVILINRLR